MIKAPFYYFSRFFYSRFEKACARPEQAQARQWKEINALIRKGSFWKEHFQIGERELREKPLEDFPITDYAFYDSILKSDFRKTHSSLNGQKILYWGNSSGTTGDRKFFPLTRVHLLQAWKSSIAGSFFFQKKFPEVNRFSLLIPCAGQSLGKTPAGVDTGFLSTLGYLSVPWFFERRLAMPKKLVRNEALFSEWWPMYALAADLGALYTLTPLTLGHYFEAMERLSSTLFAIVSGTQEMPSGLPPLRLSRKRKAYLLELLKKPLPQDVGVWWPNLKYISVWKSSICSHQVPELRKRVNESIQILDGQFVATEGYFNVLIGDELGGPIHPGSHVFEFLEIGKEIIAQNLVKPWELEVGKEYEVFLTTAMGFVRYRIGDVVKCLGYHFRSPKISFQHKSVHTLTLHKATLDVTELLQAFEMVLKEKVLEQNELASLAGSSPDLAFMPSVYGDRVRLIVSNRYNWREKDSSRLHEALLGLNDGYGIESGNDNIHSPEVLEVDSDHAFLKGLRTASQHVQGKRVYLIPIYREIDV
jgi:hypothetical protein